MLEVARQSFAENELKKIKLIEGDAHDLPLHDESQDLVYANLLIHHLLEPALAIKEMRRVLKPGGKVIITDIDRHNHKWTRSEKSDLWLGIERSDLQLWLEQAGFTDGEITDLGCTCRVNSATGVTVEIPMFLAIGDKS